MVKKQQAYNNLMINKLKKYRLHMLFIVYTCKNFGYCLIVFQFPAKHFFRTDGLQGPINVIEIIFNHTGFKFFISCAEIYLSC